MIIIISNENDYSTGEVLKHILLSGCNCIRMTEYQFINSISLEINENRLSLQFIIGTNIVDYDEITSFWFRKNKLELFMDFENINFPDFYSNDHQLKTLDFLKNEELKSLREMILFMLEKKHFLGNFIKGNANKLISFIKANECGLKTPDLVLSSNLKEIQSFFSQHKMTIAKPIEEGFYFKSENYFFYSKNSILNSSSFSNKEEKIFPSCIQEYIDKKIELRIFYLNDNCYSMAIFSQNDAKTKIDFRNYNEEKPNRMVPYKLPNLITEKIIRFMKSMNLNTGSVDMILTNENEYVFLEVNPTGQYGMISENCNYPLDKLISNYLLCH